MTPFFLRALGGLGLVANGAVPPPPPAMHVRKQASGAESLRGSTMWLEAGAQLRGAIGDAVVSAASSTVDPVAGFTLFQWLDAFAGGQLGLATVPTEHNAAVLRHAPSPTSDGDSDAAPAPAPRPLSLPDLYAISDWVVGVTLCLRAVWARAMIALRAGWGGAAPFEPPNGQPSIAGAADRAAPVATRIARWAHRACGPAPAPRYTLCGIGALGPAIDDGQDGGLRRMLATTRGVGLVT